MGTGKVTDDDWNEELQAVLRMLVKDDLTDEQLQGMIVGARDHLTRFILDSNVPNAEDVLSTYGITLDESQLTAALEESAERTSRLAPILPAIDSYAMMVTGALLQSIFSPMDEFTDEQSTHIIDFLSSLVHTAAICAVAGTLTQLERRGDVIYMWELEDFE